MTDTIIDFIRHGEPAGGRAYRGNGVDDPLSEKGWQQMKDAVGTDAPWQHVISSPMRRCREFADYLCRQHGLSLGIINDLREIGFGAWEGLTPEQVKSRSMQAYENFYRDPVAYRPEGAEDIQAFSGRVMSAFHSILQQYQGGHVLVVAHAGVIRAVLAQTLQASPEAMFRIRSDYAGITRIEHFDDCFRIVFHNILELNNTGT